jgi:hypothetical protein
VESSFRIVSSSLTRGSAVSPIRELYWPDPAGTRFSMPRRIAFRSFSRMSRPEKRVRTAIIPQPMSTPTAAGITAFSVAITVPMVAPFPR